jgi:hypothetical protein
VTITGTNDAAVIGGTTVMALTENDAIQTTADAQMSISDADNSAIFVTPTVAGTNGYGSFSVDASGNIYIGGSVSGGVIGAALLPLVKATTDVINLWNQLPGPVKTAATVLVGLAGAAAVAAAGVVALNMVLKTKAVLEFAAGMRTLAGSFLALATAEKAGTAITLAKNALQGLASAMQAPVLLTPALAAGWASLTAAVRGFSGAVASANLSSIFTSLAASSLTADVAILKAAGALKAFIATAAPLLPLAVVIGSVAAAWDAWRASTDAGSKATQAADDAAKGLAEELKG